MRGLRQLVDDCYDGGQHWYQTFRKYGAISSAQSTHCDLSMCSGNPRANYYVGNALESTLLNSAYGLWNGGAVSPKKKMIHRLLVMTPSTGFIPAKFILCDYLLFYPLIDMDSLEEQTFDNVVSLPRYTDGVGVKAFLVATNPYIGGAYFNICYTNHLGETNRWSKTMISNSTTFIGTIVHSGAALWNGSPFIEVVPGDWIRSVQSITFQNTNGGMATLVLCRPLCEIYARDVNAPAEWDFLTMKGGKLPEIKDGAYLGFLCAPNGNISGTYLMGDATFIWSD